MSREIGYGLANSSHRIRLPLRLIYVFRELPGEIPVSISSDLLPTTPSGTSSTPAMTGSRSSSSASPLRQRVALPSPLGAMAASISYGLARRTEMCFTSTSTAEAGGPPGKTP